MKIVEPSYEIISCPDGEECLAKLERIARVAYKSEDKIDDGRDPCATCQGTGGVSAYADEPVARECPTCRGHKWFGAREPSSHKLIRSILKTDRRERLSKMLGGRMDGIDWRYVEEKNQWELTARDLIDAILDNLRDDPPHESVIEHESITVKFVMDRGLSHELVRHRLCAFTQESTRYVGYNKNKYGGEIQVVRPSELTENAKVAGCWAHAVSNAEEGYMSLTKYCEKPQNARSVLPMCLKTEIVTTANLRQWIHIFRMRCSPKAHPDIRKLMCSLREEFRRRIPIIFDEV